MKKELRNKNVVIIGATGGLGSSFVEAFHNEGANLILASRSGDMSMFNESIQLKHRSLVVNLEESESIEMLASNAMKHFGHIDIVVNAVGFDVRKRLDDHNLSEIDKSINLNLKAVIIITQNFMKLMKNVKSSMIVHIGGFGDGRIAFPYYSVDVATRSATYSFVESVNRENEIEGNKTIVTFFSPSPAMTEAEAPFHALWEQMGIKIVKSEVVANEVLKAVRKKRRVYIMGGLMNSIFSKLNSSFPSLANFMTIRKYGHMLKNYLYRGGDDGKNI